MTNTEVSYEDEHGSSDSEHAILEPSKPQWLAFEQNVAELVKQLDPSAHVTHDFKMMGKISKRLRQVDVLVTGVVAGQTLTIAVECKRWAKSIGIGGVDEFAGKLQDLGVDSGVLYALAGFGAGAKARAADAVQPRIELRDLSPTAQKPPPWQAGLPEFTGFDCPNESCYGGDIRWRSWPQESGDPIEAGACDTCGTWAVLCAECACVTGFFWDIVPCQGCELHYALIWDRDGVSVDDVVISESDC